MIADDCADACCTTISISAANDHHVANAVVPVVWLDQDCD